ncbi:MAG: hypothetical protein KDA45_12780 [Planctomycetales bacterium]|nr:hypothetical protein [Planctomycetales bacterium]
MSNQRGKVYVDRAVQGALAKRIVAHWGVFFGLSLLSLFTVEYFLGDATLTVGEHLTQLWSKYAFLVILMLAILPTFVYDTLKLSNRFAGPLVRLRASIHGLAHGDEVVELKFRENDFWRELSEDFNLVAHRVTESKV